MKQFLVLFSALIVAVAAEVMQESVAERKEQDVISSTRFGRCTTKAFVKHGLKCDRKFVMVFRKNLNADCYKHYNLLVQCKKHWLHFCLSGKLPEEQIKSMESAVTKGTLFDTGKLYCGNERFQMKPAEDNDPCDKEYYQTVEMYVNNFIDKFRHKRSDPKLCWEYDFTLKNIAKLTKTHCKEFNSAMMWNLVQKFNPFCSKGQRRRPF